MHYLLNFNCCKIIQIPLILVLRLNFRYRKPSDVRLEVFNMLGQKVQTLKNERMAAGFYSVVTFEAGGLSSGVYVYQLRMGNAVLTKRMLLLK